MSASIAAAAAFSLIICLAAAAESSEPFILSSFRQCLADENLSSILFTPDSPSFAPLLQSSIQNLLFSSDRRRPSAILLPSSERHVSPALLCCRAHRLPLRPRSGGHDYEGLSYRSLSASPFALLDLSLLRHVTINTNPAAASAVVQSGATVGDLYYRIAAASLSLAFPAGICPTVGISGLLAGGGFGTMLRKFGLAADNIMDADIIDAKGRLLNRSSMGEDLFWAIRGGGGSSFGVVLSWKLKLLPVPTSVSVFSITRTFNQGAVPLIERWQHVAHDIDDELFIRIVIQRSSEVEALFISLFLGSCGDLLALVGARFPELGLKREECREMSWGESVMYFAGFDHGEPLEKLLVRATKPERFFKAKSDFVKEPIPGFVFRRIWDRFLDDGAGVMIMEPFGGAMKRIPAGASPFPHREGNLYNIQYFVEWRDGGDVEARKRVGWIKRMYQEMGPYVSKNPRTAYLNYRDLDLGMNELHANSTTSYAKAAVWGVKYFKGNFARLAAIKGRVDPDDYFRNEQSIPPILAAGKCRMDSEGICLQGSNPKDRTLDVL